MADKVNVNEFWIKLGIVTCTLNEARQAIEDSFLTGTPVCLVGEAGIGKSQLTKQIAKLNGMKYHAFFAAHVEREDIIGVPFPSKDGKFYEFLNEKSIHDIIASDEPTLLVFDEWNRGDKAVMNAIFTVMEDRRLGNQILPPNVHILACMNPSEDAYNVNEAEKDPAFRRRLTFLGVQANEVVWIEHATKVGFHSAVIDFIRAKPTLLNDTMTREAGKVYANPAGWEKVSNILKALEAKELKLDDPANRRRLMVTLSGIVGVGTANEFMGFIEDNYSTVNPKLVLTDYAKVREKVLAWTKMGPAGISRLQQLFESVTLTLATEHTDPSVVCENITDFLADMPKDTLAVQHFFAKLKKYISEVSAREETDQYTRALNEKLVKLPKWVKLINDHLESTRAAGKERAKG